MNLKGKMVVVTGGTKGIGKELIKLFNASGADTVCLARGCEEKVSQEGIRYISCDVSDSGSVGKAIELVGKEYGRLDFLINNAGVGISGSLENTSETDFDYIFGVNVKGVFNCTRYALPFLREAKGRIINVSSVAGLLAIPYQAFYSATKAAVLSLSDALRNEVRPFGVKVLTVLPGDVKTDFTTSRKKNATEGPYAQLSQKSVEVMEKDERGGMSAAFAARKIFGYATRKRMPQTKVVGNKYKLLCFIGKLLPKRVASKLLFDIYGGNK